MLTQHMNDLIDNGSKIRKMFVEGAEMAARFGKENVFDFSLGNPVAPVPPQFSEAIATLLATETDTELHGYMPNAGYPAVRQKIAENLNARYGCDLSAQNIVMTVGAAGALNIVLKSIVEIDDEVVVLRPYFAEYRAYVANWHGKTVEVDPLLPSFLPDLADLAAKITPRTKALILNNPVNPTGVVYDSDTLGDIAAILEAKQAEYGTEIYLISDEPYRELVYDGETVPYLPDFYANTFVGYSFSKSLSVPGERVGYVVIPPAMTNFARTAEAIAVANRVCGYVNAPSLLQKAVAECLDVPVNVDFYDTNRRLLVEGLTALGYECVPPQGAFYLFVKSPTADEEEFVAAAKEHHIIVVGGSSFAAPGYVRIAYCVSADTIRRSLPGFAKLAQQFGL